MNLRRARTIIVCIILGSLVASLMMWRQGLAELREKSEALRQQTQDIAKLIVENQKISNRLDEARNEAAHDRTGELLKLRREAEALRKHTNETARHLADSNSLINMSGGKKLNFTMKSQQPGNVYVVTDSESEEYNLQLSKMAAGERNRYTGDARNLSFAVLTYAKERNGEVPATFADAVPYKWKNDLPLAGTYKDRDTMAGANDFEMVYHGSLSDLKNIPQQAVAMIRQRQPWQTPNSKWARIYTMVDGRVCVVESDDNFQAWEAEHIIPPATNFQ